MVGTARLLGKRFFLHRQKRHPELPKIHTYLSPAIYCLPSWCSGQRISCNAQRRYLRGNGQWNSCNTLPHCPGAVGSAASAIQCLTAWGHWAVELMQYTASARGANEQLKSCNAVPHHAGQLAVQLLQYAYSLLGGSGQCNSCNALCHCLGAVDSALPRCTAAVPGASEQCNSCDTLPPSLGAMDSRTAALHCLTAWRQWAIQFVQYPASLPGAGSRVIPAVHCLTASGLCSATPAMHCLTASGQWAVELLHCNTLPLRVGGMGSTTPEMRCLISWGLLTVQFVQYADSLPGGNCQCNSCNAVPHRQGGGGQCSLCFALLHCLLAVGSGTPAMHCLTA